MLRSTRASRRRRSFSTSLRPLSCALALAGLLGACGGGGGGGGSGSGFGLDVVDHGFGRLLPHRAAPLGPGGEPLEAPVEVRRLQDLYDALAGGGVVLAPTSWPTAAQLPDGEPGNHFLVARFTRALEPDSVLARAPGTGATTTGAVSVEVFDPASGDLRPVAGRAFVGGWTVGRAAGEDGLLPLERWVELRDGEARAADVGGARPGLGFPGTESGRLAGARDLVDPRALVFVPDADDDLATHETFPLGVQVRLRISTGVRATDGAALAEPALAAASVGEDVAQPEVLQSGGLVAIQPGNGELDVDPEVPVRVEFSEPVQPASLGEFEDGTAPALSSAVRLTFGPSTGRVDVPFHVRPVSPFDLATYELLPYYPFPGSGPELDGGVCGAFGQVDVVVNEGVLTDLAGNANERGVRTFFATAEGAGLVNAPVTPDAIYALRLGAAASLSVLDLNGFGAGPGDPSWDLLDPIVEGHSNFPNDPNVQLAGSGLVPPLAPGTCTFDGGSSGPFTLAKDSSLRAALVGAPTLEQPVDLALGHALDGSFNNSLPFGCRAGGGNLCAATGLKGATLVQGGAATVRPATGGETLLSALSGHENLVSWAPHPNPPPLVFPPLCLSPLIAAQEPTSVVTGLPNLLGPGSNPMGRPDEGLPPDGLLGTEQYVFFQGPSPPQSSPTLCATYAVRQQIGHFLYVADRRRDEVLVLNSNRMTVLERISVPDPAGLAMSPDLELLAVTSGATDQVVFVDVDPSSSRFHTIVKRTDVGRSPGGVAWQPGNEDVLVCNAGDDSMSVVSALSLEVRKTVRNLLRQPLDVAISPRQNGFGLQRGVYFAYILNADGSVAVFESGPDGVNGWGQDDVIGAPPFRFARPKAIQPDPLDLRSGVWIVHEEPLGPDGRATGQPGGALSRLGLVGGTTGQIPLGQLGGGGPSLRDLQFGVTASVGEGPGGLTGAPTDLAFDDLRNLGALPNVTTTFSAGSPVRANGKGAVRVLNGSFVPTNAPRFVLVAVPASVEGPGVVDVLELGSLVRFDTNPFRAGVQSVPCAGVTALAHYFRQ